MIHQNSTRVKSNSSESYQNGTNSPRASHLLANKSVGVTVERRFNLGDFESLNLSYHLGGDLPDDVDPLWAIDDLTDELKERIERGAGPDIAKREAIAKESFLTTPKNAQQQILRLHLAELGVDVDALREVLRRGIDLRTVVERFDREKGGRHDSA